MVSAIGATALGLVFAHLGMVDPKAGGPYAYARDHSARSPVPDQRAVLGRERDRQRRHRGVGGGLPRGVLPGAGESGGVQPLHGRDDLVVRLVEHARREGGRGFTTFTTAAGILPIAVVGLLGWHWFNPRIFMQGWNPDAMRPASAITQSASIALWAFLGVESAAVSAGVIENPRRNVPLATLIGLAFPP
jgi:arginine:agmatine antiporter